MTGKKPLEFHGDANERLREFPADVRGEIGYQLYLVEQGFDPSDWKPMSDIGKGVREIRVRDASGIYRTVYLATLPDAVHVYHVFQKKTQKTAQHDIDIARKRYREHMRRIKK